MIDTQEYSLRRPRIELWQNEDLDRGRKDDDDIVLPYVHFTTDGLRTVSFTTPFY